MILQGDCMEVMKAKKRVKHWQAQPSQMELRG